MGAGNLTLGPLQVTIQRRNRVVVDCICLSSASFPEIHGCEGNRNETNSPGPGKQGPQRTKGNTDLTFYCSPSKRWKLNWWGPAPGRA